MFLNTAIIIAIRIAEKSSDAALIDKSYLITLRVDILFSVPAVRFYTLLIGKE